MLDSTSLSPQTNLALIQQAANSSNMSLEEMQYSDDLDAVAHDFEAVFISEMIKPMFEGIETDTMFGGGKGEEVFRGMMIQEYGKVIADRDVTGIQTQVKNALIEIQSQASSDDSTPYSASSNPNQIIDAEFTETLPEQTLGEGEI